MAKKRSFWSTVPGILTGLAAVITAVGGLLLALSQAGLLGGTTGGSGSGPGPVADGSSSRGGGKQPEDDVEEREPNDDFAAAGAIPVDGSVRAFLSDGGDVDVFSFSTGETSRNVLLIRLTNEGTFAPDVFVYDGLKNQLENKYSITQGADVEIELSARPSSTYYVKVNDLDGFADRRGDYQLAVRLE